MSRSVKTHWDQIYTRQSAHSVSWYQPRATQALAWIAGTGGSLIDVGGGTSTLFDELVLAGNHDVTLLDISDAALNIVWRRLGRLGRLGRLASSVRWITGDVTTVALPAHAYDVWHDRAVFHFLTEEADRQAYVAQLQHAMKPGGHVIIATFAPDGPAQCSGLPVVRYSPATLQTALGPAFHSIEHAHELHETPAGAMQPFLYCHFIRRA